MVMAGVIHSDHLEGYLMWPIWIVPIATGVLVYAGLRKKKIGAGADWLSLGRKSWVDTYALTEIKVKTTGSGNYADITDNEGRFVGVDLVGLHEDRDLWDLVYNGMLHSVVLGGATTNRKARTVLGLPDTAED